MQTEPQLIDFNTSHWNFCYLELYSDSAVVVLAAELIDAKQSLAGDLYFLIKRTQMMKPLQRGGSRLMCHSLESCCRMLMMSHFWYSGWWHHLEFRWWKRRTVAKQRLQFSVWCQKKIKPDSSALKCSLLWHVITLPQRLLGNVTRTPWMFWPF